MKYTIESNGRICIETIELTDGRKFTRKNERNQTGCQSLDQTFDEQFEKEGFNDEIAEKMFEMFSGCFVLDFIELTELVNDEM